mmetsp:Transcript_27730/g.60595  ORF Transcript_27730/g.60595 Transcript_27730/m.60595 type:complete len:507 (-) Transcript_27730:294-1814(-)|eukprot:CAMPEP_0118927354 /NCGR_PEP_ID=MMETSP1169-20130426/4838_1 /TAXON_ID=36882 /ORGANISM="Pyramimonas obovata, Strain CCMP722" /LENGTH=506 /DNA_ID=CAMNT_0006869101 /DNA_START=36 /DNA_END=1556 /DNA_ORIENTATION=-
MQVLKTPRERKLETERTPSLSTVKDDGRRRLRLSMYPAPPQEEIAIEDFERTALDRLRVLKGIEEAMTRGTKPQEMEGVVQRLQQQHLPLLDAVTQEADTERELKDAVSHFVLRLAYCRTEELRRWFLSQESALFKYRFKALPPSSQVRFLEENQLPYTPLTAAEYDAVKEQLETIRKTQYGSAQEGPVGATHYYKVPFEEVAELVRNRKVYLLRGQAYVPREHLASLVVGLFRARLSKALAVTARQWAARIAPMEADRLAPVVEALSSRHLGTTDFSQERNGGAVSLADLDGLSAKSFPLCMRNLHLKVKEEHHLRHFGRMQLGLFLKGIGLTLEDAMTFWKSEFTKRMPAEKFEKQYAYNVRYNYGKEGKRTDYTPYSCMKIILSTPGGGDHHGCPYRHWSDENLRATLRSLRLAPKVVTEVMQKKQAHHYQLACAATFEGAHGCACESGVNHPNQYFEASRQALTGTAPASSAALSPHTPAAPKPSRAETTPGVPAMSSLVSV